MALALRSRVYSILSCQFGMAVHIRKDARRVNPLIETHLGTLLWCGPGNCDMFCPVELEKVLNL
jgi:hypothetical protein